MSRVVVDTHLVVWAAQGSDRLPPAAHAIMAALVSAARLWEVAVKSGLGRPDFRVDAARLRKGLLQNGYRELPVLGVHAVATMTLPPLHKDPFDRILVAQAMVEGVLLLTADAAFAAYGGPVRLV